MVNGVDDQLIGPGVGDLLVRGLDQIVGGGGILDVGGYAVRHRLLR